MRKDDKIILAFTLILIACCALVVSLAVKNVRDIIRPLGDLDRELGEVRIDRQPPKD